MTAINSIEKAHKGGGPNFLQLAAEGPRVLVEASMLMVSWGSLRRLAPQGDAHPVLVLPGFMGGDGSTLLLRRYLDSLGYSSLPWLQGQNIGRLELLEGVMRRFYRAHQSYGTQISLIGQSLGGVFARKIAQQFPDAVRCVITLGSPFNSQSDEVANPAVARLFESVSGSTVEEMRQQSEAFEASEPIEVPSTAIYSRTDGVVDWRACIEPATEISENVEVRGSHSGMAVAPDVLHVIADRLAQNPQAWQPFNRSKACRSLYYPTPKNPRSQP